MLQMFTHSSASSYYNTCHGIEGERSPTKSNTIA